MNKLDVIIFGASGFTGKYTVFHAVEILNKFKWGIAGRNQGKLESVLKEMSHKSQTDLSMIPVIVADVSDELSLINMTSRTNLIINCVGPYCFYGEQVVKACLETSTHYVDVTAEPQFMERMQLEYNEAAQNKGIYMVSACGYESIPAEMGIAYLQQQFGGAVNSVELYFRVSHKGDLPKFATFANYTSLESMIFNISNNQELKDIRKKLFKQKLPELEPELKSRIPFHRQSHVGRQFSVPYPGVDHSVIMRSQRHFYEHDNQRPIQLKVYFTFISFIQFFRLSLSGLIFATFSLLKCGRSLLKKYPKFFSLGLISRDGPTEHVMNGTQMNLTFIAEGWKGQGTNGPINKKIVVRLSSEHSAYTGTCVASLLAAKTILKEHSKLPGNGGVLTPGAAFAKTNLISELSSNGFTFEVLEQNEY